MGKSQVMEYFSKLKPLWDELGIHPVIPRCTCNCKCGATKEISRIFEEEKSHNFFISLNLTKYNIVPLVILNTEPLSSLNKASVAIRDDEM